MRLESKTVSDKDGEGWVVVRPEVDEDLWHCYNLVALGDRVRSTTLRKVVKEGTTGTTKNERVRTELTLEVRLFGPAALLARGVLKLVADVTLAPSPHPLPCRQVEDIAFDPVACVIRLKGRNCVENRHVKVRFARAACGALRQGRVERLFLTRRTAALRACRSPTNAVASFVVHRWALITRLIWN